MKTVKEIAELTGVSKRTLHYYDEIGLLVPAEKNKAGYRLYDDDSLETLQQILFFREFDMPLKEIKAVMQNPAFDRDQILQMQRKMLVAKKERMERLIDSIDEILKGENKMDFEIFNKTDIEEICRTTAERMPDFMRESIIKKFGSIEQWKQHYLEVAAREEMQKGYQKIVEWYGDKEKAMEYMTNPPTPEEAKACLERTNAILDQLSGYKGLPPDDPRVSALVEQYGLEIKQLYQIKDEKGIMLSCAGSYSDARVKAATDEKYGEGTAVFFEEAIQKFYGEIEQNKQAPQS